MQPAKRVAWLFLLLGAIGPVSADYLFTDRNWAIEAHFPDAPKTDGILTPSPQGDIKVQRFYWEPASEHYLLARFEYPLAFRPDEAAALYAKSFGDLLKSRPGEVKGREKFALGPYAGEKMTIAYRREKTVREVRFVLVGGILYMMNIERPEQGGGGSRATVFLDGVQVRADLMDPATAAETGRWRDLVAGRFRVRYDASRWYRDPADQEAGVFNLLRVDQLAEAQFIAEPKPLEKDDIETSVLATAREGAESVSVKKRGKRLRGAVEVTELEFEARVEHATYHNHGYFYSGPEGTVQLRSWAVASDYPGVEGDIAELLDGLTVAGVAR